MSKIYVIGLQTLALAALLGFNTQPAIMPTRRRVFEPDFDLNRSLSDPGKHRERELRKAGRKLRLRDLQRKALTGGGQ